MMWEYGSITFTADAVHDVVEDTTGAGGLDSDNALAAAGAAGWELVSTFHHPGAVMASVRQSPEVI